MLAICSRNQWRSPTAERVINTMPGFQGCSAGTEAAARVRVNVRLIAWADVIIVMEHRHARRLRAMFGDLLSGKPVYCLDVPDDYQFMEPALVDLLRARLEECLHAP